MKGLAKCHSPLRLLQDRFCSSNWDELWRKNEVFGHHLNRYGVAVQDEPMKTLFSRILLAQLVTVFLALVVVTAITRVTLTRGFKGFLETQEPIVLQTLVPVFEGLYETRGGWEFLKDDPGKWQRIWHLSRPRSGESRGNGPGPRRGPRPLSGPPEQQREFQLLRWMPPQERGMFRDRLYLLDENQAWVNGAPKPQSQTVTLEAIEVDGATVGWLGFAPMGEVLPPDAQRFLAGQVRITAVSFVVALLVAIGLAYLLAQKVSRPVRRLGEAVRQLSHGDYRIRVSIESSDETAVLARQVNQLAETLEKNQTARQRWMADIAHELRTPVAILKGEMEALADGVRVADERMTHSLKEEIDQLTSLVDDLQTLAMSDAGALNISKESFNLTELVEQCAESFKHRLNERRISLKIQSDAPVTLVADQARIRQLLLNLFENSARYSEQGAQVVLSLSQNRESVVLVLEDSGPGLRQEEIERLFERFYRVEGSRSRSGGGSGLGLSICKNIAEAHGGTIHAESSRLGGLKIQVTLPL